MRARLHVADPVLTCLQVAPGSDTTAVIAVLNVLFMSLSNLGAINLNAVVVVAAHERAVLYRERASGMYAASAYVHASALVRGEEGGGGVSARSSLPLQGRSVI